MLSHTGIGFAIKRKDFAPAQTDYSGLLLLICLFFHVMFCFMDGNFCAQVITAGLAVQGHEDFSQICISKMSRAKAAVRAVHSPRLGFVPGLAGTIGAGLWSGNYHEPKPSPIVQTAFGMVAGIIGCEMCYPG